MHGNMTAVPIQSNKMILSEVKDNSMLLEPSYRKKTNEIFGQPNISKADCCLSGVRAQLWTTGCLLI